MSFGFKSIGHFFASVAHDIVKAGHVVAAIAPKIAAQEPLVEGITAMVAPQFVAIERGAFAVFGLAAHAVETAGEAADQNGLNVQLDAETIAAIRELIPVMRQFATSIGSKAPVATPAK